MFRMSIAVLLPSIRVLFGLDETKAGVLFSSLFLAMLITLNFSGHLSDRFGRRIVLATGLLLSLSGTLLLGSTNSYLTSFGAFCLSGVGGGLFVPSLYASMGEMPRSRGFLTGFTNAFYALGGFLGPLLSGIITSQYNWRFPLYLFSAITLFSVVSFWVLSRNLSSQKRGTTKNMDSYSGAFKSRRVLIASVSMFAANFGFVTFVTWTPTLLITIKELDLVQTGTIFGVWALTGGLGAIAFGWLSDRYDRRLVIFGSGSLTAAIALIYYVYDLAFPVLVIISIPLGFVSYAFWNLQIAFVQDVVDSKAIVSVTGFIQSIALLAGVIAPIISAKLIVMSGLAEALIVCVSVSYIIHGASMLLTKVSITACRDYWAS